MANLAAALDPEEAVAQYSEAIALEKHGGVDHLMLVPLLYGQARCLRALHLVRTRSSWSVQLGRRLCCSGMLSGGGYCCP